MTQHVATIAPEVAANPWLTRRVRIVDMIQETEGVATYRLKYDDSVDADDYRFLPGQFNMLYLPGVGESAISMSGDAEELDGWIHTVRVAGNVTRTLARLRPGDALGLRGPFGAPWPVEQFAGADVVIVAGGLGMAPLRPLIYHLLRHRGDFGRVWLIVGARSPDGLLYPREYDAWRRAGIDMQTTVDRPAAGWTGNIGVVTVLLDRLPLGDASRTQLAACGPEVMMKYAALSGLQRGIGAERIWISLERNMQCAAGLCGHCQLGPAFICKDGPVLRWDGIEPYLHVKAL
jgi:NAD(P)H-flavin reductase